MSASPKGEQAPHSLLWGLAIPQHTAALFSYFAEKKDYY